MILTIFGKNDSVLLVGEGNFSFAVALSQLNLNINITATCYEPQVDQKAGKMNIEYLKNNGIRVFLGVDGTKLRNHPVLKSESFDKIIFNFPHVGGKMRIEKNRELLKQFFIAVENSVKSNGCILVTLCNGQGGTCMDNPQRRWDDTWKITEMAAHGNFVLTKIEPFIWSTFQDYIVTGYRSLDKPFHSEGALTHVFVKSEAPDMHNIAPEKKINICHWETKNSLWKDVIQKTDYSSLHDNQSFCSQTYTFDITFSVNKNFSTDELYTVLYNCAGCIINDIEFVGSYMPPHKNEEKQTYRITYKSNILPLHRQRVIDVHHNLIKSILESNLNVMVTT